MCKDSRDHATESGKYKCAQGGCGECLEALLAAHRRLVVAVIKRQWLGGLAYGDLVQEGQVALWQAIERYEPERGTAFSTYAWVVIERHIWQVVARGNRKEGGIKLAEVAEPLTLAEERLAARECGQAVAAVIKQLSPRLGQVVVAAYGLDGQPARSLAAIGREQGVSRERVRQLHNEALRQLRPGKAGHTHRNQASQLHNEALRQLRRPDRSERLRLWWGEASRASYQYMQQQNRHCLRQRRGRRS